MSQYQNILLISGDPKVQALLSSYFSSLGCSGIREAVDGRSGIDLVRDCGETTDLVVCDLRLPEMDGLGFIRHLGIFGYRNDFVIVCEPDRAILNAAKEFAVANNLSLRAALEKPLSKSELDATFIEAKAPANQVGDASQVSPKKLRAIIKEQRITPHFQPVIELSSGRTVGVEAFARCVDPELGIVDAAKFIPTAETLGVVDKLTNVMLLKLLRQLGDWKSRGLFINLGVNVPPQQFVSDGFCDNLSEIVEGFGLDRGDITIEVSETAVYRGLTDFMEATARHTMAGFKIAIDDFGIGPIDSEMLERLAFSEIKLDQSIVRADQTNGHAQSKIADAVRLARSRDALLGAKGVETKEQCDQMFNFGFQLAQGYLFAPAMSGPEFEEWHSNKRSA